MSAVEVVLDDPWPGDALCVADGEGCDRYANAEISFRIHGMILRSIDALLLCADHLDAAVADLKAGRFDEVDEISGVTTSHGVTS